MSDLAPSAPGSAAYLVDAARQGGDQFLSLYRDMARIGVDFAAMWLESFGQVVPGFPGRSVAAFWGRWAQASFDVAERAIRIQREVVTEALARLEPAL